MDFREQEAHNEAMKAKARRDAMRGSKGPEGSVFSGSYNSLYNSTYDFTKNSFGPKPNPPSFDWPSPPKKAPAGPLPPYHPPHAPAPSQPVYQSSANDYSEAESSFLGSIVGFFWTLLTAPFVWAWEMVCWGAYLVWRFFLGLVRVAAILLVIGIVLGIIGHMLH